MSERVAIYPGSFDPPTLGHLDLVRRAARLFDKLIIAVARNSEKNSLFTADERIQMFRENLSDLKNLEIIDFKGLIVDLARDRKATVLIRGLRAVSDFEYEMTMAGTNRKMYPECETIVLMPSEEYIFISSRLVKEIVMLGGDASAFVPANVEAAMEKRLQK